MQELEIKFINHSISGNETSLHVKDEEFNLMGVESQINIYYKNFGVDDLDFICESFPSMASILEEIKSYSKFSLRTRMTRPDIDIVDTNIIIKAANKDVINGNDRREITFNIDPDKFDRVDELLSNRYGVESKWDRVRRSYFSSNLIMSVDKNSGYGIIGEIEILDPDLPSNPYNSVEDLVKLIDGTEYELLKVDRVNEWYKIYCTMWDRFYKTGKTFKDFEDTKHLL